MKEVKPKRLENTRGEKSKASLLQMLLLFHAIVFSLYVRFFAEEISNMSFSFGLYLFLAIIGLLLIVIVAIKNRTREDQQFSWALWIIPTAGIFINMMRYFTFGR